MTLRSEEINEAPEIELRIEDIKECQRDGLSPEWALGFSIAESYRSFAVYANDEVLGVWGYRPDSILGHSCNAWFLSTPAIERHPLAAARESKRVVSYLLTLYPIIYVRVDQEYTVSVNWLEWLGFEVYEKELFFLRMKTERPRWDS